MSKTIIVCGYGPGISDAVARKFGAEGFAVALVARGREKLAVAEAALGATGLRVKAFPCDLGDPDAVKKLVQDVRASLGPVTVIHWNAYAGLAGDLTTAAPTELQKVFDVGVTGLVAAVQEALPDLKTARDPAVLVTGGGFAFYDKKIDDMVVSFNAMGLAIVKSAQHKLVGLLHAKLAPDGIYVGEVVVLGSVKGTAFDHGNATLAGSTIADHFWKIYLGRTELSVSVSS